MGNESLDKLAELLRSASDARDYGRMLAVCREAMPLTTTEDMKEWYMYRFNLGLALMFRDANNKEADYHESIDVFASILEYLPRLDYRSEWAETHRALAEAYVEFSEHHDEELLNRAVEHYSQAADVFGEEGDGLNRGLCIEAIAIAYLESQVGDRVANLRLVIEKSREAMAIFQATGASEEADRAKGFVLCAKEDLAELGEKN